MAWLVTYALPVFALGISIWAILTSRRTNSKILQIEQNRERDRQDKEQRANITTKFEHLQQHGHYALYIENEGVAEARDVTVILGGKPISEFRNIDHKNPQIPVIGPGSSVSYTWPCANNSCPPLLLEIAWSDDSKRPGHYTTTLTHPRKPT